MNDSTKGGFIVVLLIAIIAFGSGAVFGMNNIGEDMCKQILPTSISTSPDNINTINEDSFTVQNISLQKDDSNYTNTVDPVNTTDNINNTNNITNNTNTANNKTTNTTNNTTVANNTTNTDNNTASEELDYNTKNMETLEGITNNFIQEL